MRILFFVSILLFQFHSAATLHNRVSPQRPKSTSWKEIAKKLRPVHLAGRSRSSIDEAKPLPEIDFDLLENWGSYEVIKLRFDFLRDLRFLKETLNHKELRRSTWLYPDDGCYARASLMNENLLQMGVQPLAKIFVYGDLLVQTTNTFSGVVSWWYHVAPIVTDGKENYILDPSVEASRPILLNEWLERMGDPTTMKISICTTDSYTPYSPCLAPEPDEDESALQDQVFFLSLERFRLFELGRDADRELGDFPPWQ